MPVTNTAIVWWNVKEESSRLAPEQIRTNKKLRVPMMTVASILLLVFAGSLPGWAQNPCPSSPSYKDFSTNGNCLTFNGNATIPTESGVLQITGSQSNQVGSAWYTTQQVVQNGFTTSFQFQLPNASNPPADGFAFVIQNSSLQAIGFSQGNGGALGYGDADASTDPSQGAGIPHSLAIEFDTFQNGWDPATSHVAIQTCGAGANTSHHGQLCAGESGPSSTVASPVAVANLTNGAVHTVTITYVPACSSCDPVTVANLQVVLDGTNLFPNGVAYDLSNLGLTEGGMAFVGFTGATGLYYETHDILSWSFAPTQGSPINQGDPGSLQQSFIASSVPGQHLEFDFDYRTANNSESLTVADGTTPFVNFAGITPFDWATIVNGTAMADAPCLTAAGQSVCAVTTLTCTTAAESTPSGANCPQSTIRNVLFQQELDVNLNQPGITNGQLTIPPGYAPGLAMAPDVLVSGGQCSYPAGEPMAGQLCPQNIMTQFEDLTPRGGGTGTTTNSSYIFFCCEPEWQTTPTIALWSNSTSVPASFTSVPPTSPGSTNDFHAAQGASVVFGAQPRGTILDTTFPVPGEQTLNNSIPCPALGSPIPWSTQDAKAFTVAGQITEFDDNGTASPLAEGAYDAHFFSVDCDSFEELVYPPQLDVTPGTPGPNVVRFKTVPFNIDTTKPNVTSVTLNPPGGNYAPGTIVTATVSCSDPSSLSVQNFFSGIATCGGQAFGGNQASVTTTPIPLSTSGVGAKTFTATAVDVAGNTSVPVTVNYQVVGSADVAVGMLSNLLVKTGNRMTYYISVVNLGPSAAAGVNLIDVLPAGATFVSSGFAIESCNFSSGTPSCSITAPTNSCGNVAGSCSIGNLPPWTLKNPTGAFIQITVNVTARAGTTITNTATVSAANSDPNLKNNTARWTTAVTK